MYCCLFVTSILFKGNKIMEAANDGHINTVFPMGRMGRNGLRQTMKELIILQESPVKLKRKEGKN